MRNKWRIEQRAVYIGLGIFSILYIGFIFLGNTLGVNSLGTLFWLQILMLIVSGFAAGFIAKTNGWLNGLMVGVAAPIVLSLGMSLVTMELNTASEIFSALGVFWLLQSVFFCSFGGFIWDVYAKHTSRNP